ncbi:MAG: protein kinase [Planctomycetes bacterium]|nr:protein kinase [Planctomycetota bacterium]
MPTNPPNHAEDLVGESPDEAGVEGPSLEEIVERLERVRPKVILGARRPIPDLAGQSIGRYKIRRIVGRGAFGVVYQARDEQLGRDVALKVPRPEVLFDEEKLRRFESEAATAATLEHPSIIPIYEADLSGPTPYIASAYCVGPDLGEWLANRETPIPVDQAARFVIKLAEGVHYAHRQGVLHRDLKPSNIMLEPCRNTGPEKNQLEHFEPRLTDFGLAKLLEGDPKDTRSSIMLGTPRYMAPEQFDKRLGVVGVQSDVYALGALLYELLIGEPAVEGSSHMELMLSILDREVTPPSRIRKLVTPTLEAICLKSLEKRPSARYSTALELAEDLGRYLRGEPTVARPLALPGRVVKWIRLNPLAASLLTVVTVSMVGLVIGVLWHNSQLSEQLAVSDQLRIESAENAGRSLRARYVADMQLTQQAISGGRFSEAQSRLEKYQPGNDGAKVSDFAWHLLTDQLKKTRVDFDFHGPLTALATSDVLKASVTGGKDGLLRLFETATGVLLATTQAHEGSVNAIVFAVDGTTLVSGGDDGMLCVWDTSLLLDYGKIELVAKRQAHEGDLYCLAITPDVKLIASGGGDNKLYLWNFDNLEPAGELVGHADWVRTLDFSPDGKFLASGCADKTVRRWDIETKKEVDRFIGHENFVLCLKHHPTEPLIVSGGTDRSIKFWDLSTGEESQQLDVFNGWIRSLSFSADGNQLAVAADDPRVMLLKRGGDGHYAQEKVMFTDRARNLAVSFANSNGQIVSAGNEGASAWSSGCNLRGKELYVALGHPLQAVSPSNENMVTVVTSHSAININLKTGAVRDISLREDSPKNLVLKVAISAEGNLIAAYEDNRDRGFLRVVVSDEKRENERVLFLSSGESDGISVSPSGRLVAAGTPNRLIRIWQAPDFKQETIVRSPFDCNFDSFMIDDTGTQLFLQPPHTREMTILDVATSEPVAKLQNVESLLNRSADGQLLAISRSDYSVTIYDTQLGLAIQSLPSHASDVIAACFSPTEPLLATITNEGQIVLWALDTGEMLIHFQADFSNAISLRACLAFTSDGRNLVAAGGVINKQGHHSELQIWQAP